VYTLVMVSRNYYWHSSNLVFFNGTKVQWKWCFFLWHTPIII